MFKKITSGVNLKHTNTLCLILKYTCIDIHMYNIRVHMDTLSMHSMIDFCISRTTKFLSSCRSIARDFIYIYVEFHPPNENLPRYMDFIYFLIFSDSKRQRCRSDCQNVQADLRPCCLQSTKCLR